MYFFNAPFFRDFVTNLRKWRWLFILLIASLEGGPFARPVRAAAELASADLIALSIEELMTIEITSASKKRERLSETASAVYVITAEDIRRSGATSIPELLRMAPGIQVARMDANKWAVTARGLGGRFANKLLVMIDGRSVYTPFFSGVFWESQDTLLADIDRIEVIRGPGASVWGANAVNGVINIITKHARDTRGGLAGAGAGTEERAFGQVRYGGTIITDAAWYRLYAKGFERDNSESPSGRPLNDDWDGVQAGFRIDAEPNAADHYTFHGDIRYGTTGDSLVISSPFPERDGTIFIPFENDLFSANILGRFQRSLAGGGELTAQLYYDRVHQDLTLTRITYDTVDLELQHRFSPLKRHDMQWGIGYRLIADSLDTSQGVIFDPMDRTDDIFSAFIQDEIALFPDALSLTIGVKGEHNDYTGFEWQPTARILWNVSPKHHFWASASRAIRSPSRAEHDLSFVASPSPDASEGGFVPVGNRDFASERMNAFELGYRYFNGDRFILDIALFQHQYENLRTLETPPDSPGVIANNMSGYSRGVEVAAEWQPYARLTFKAAYSWFDIDLEIDPSADGPLDDLEIRFAEDIYPAHQLSLRVFAEIARNLELTLWGRYVDELPIVDIPSYVEMDAVLNWKATERLEWTLVGRNLLDKDHTEFQPDIFQTAQGEVERSVYAKVTWRF